MLADLVAVVVLVIGFVVVVILDYYLLLAHRIISQRTEDADEASANFKVPITDVLEAIFN